MARTQHTRYLVMVPNYWGIGETVDDAVEELLAAGGYVGGGYEVMEFDETAIFQNVHPVHGMYEYTAAEGHEFPNAPTKRMVSPIEALRTRESAITKALVNEDIDADIAAEMREERALIREDIAALA